MDVEDGTLVMLIYRDPRVPPELDREIQDK